MKGQTVAGKVKVDRFHPTMIHTSNSFVIKLLPSPFFSPLKPRPLSEVTNRKMASVREVSLAEVKSAGLMMKKHLADTDIKTSSGMAWISTVNTDKGDDIISNVRNDDSYVTAHEKKYKKIMFIPYTASPCC